MKRVAWICAEWPMSGQHVGGVGRYVARMAESVREQVELTVLTFEGALQMSGVRFVELPRPEGRFERYYTTPFHVRRAIDKLSPDIVHAHGDDWLVKKSWCTVRSFYGTSWNEALTSRGLRRINHFILAGTEHLSARKADVRIGIAPESAKAFNCQIEMPPFVPRSHPPDRAPADRPSVLFIGSFGGRKRGHLAERAVREASVMLRQAVELVVIGPGDDQASWRAGVTHLSGLDDLEVSRQLSRAWALVVPSSYEGFGIPLVEGLEHGVAVVASQNAGSGYVISRGNGDLPVDVAFDADLGRTLARRLQNGPWLNAAENAAAGELVAAMVSEASPERLLEVYARSESGRAGPW